MSNDYEKTFSVRVPPERAFRAFTDPRELEQWFTPKFDADAQEGAPGVKADAASPGGQVHFEVTQIKNDELLCYRQWAADPETGIDVTVVFEPVEGGTRITVTHAGFGGDSILKSDSVRNGMAENYADLTLYLEYGVSFPRHRDMASKAWERPSATPEPGPRSTRSRRTALRTRPGSRPETSSCSSAPELSSATGN
jgi:uncharacterized protein YndB with AHSA1/START domain